VLGEQLLQGIGEGIWVDDLTLTESAGIQRLDRRRLHLHGTVHRDFGRGDAASLEVETDQPG